MDVTEEMNTKAVLAQTEEALLIIEQIRETLERGSLDCMQWFYLMTFLSEVGHHMDKIRGAVDKSRPSRPIRRILAESYLGATCG